MFLYIRLALAHFIGDFPLQFNRIYALKLKGLKGVIPHVLILMACYITFSWPYLHLWKMWAFIFFLSIIHLFQDWGKIKVSSGTPHRLLYYTLDQALHIVATTTILLTDLKFLKPPEPTGNFFNSLYLSDTVVLFLIIAIIASYNGHYMILLFKKDYLNTSYSSTSFEKWYGILERTIMVSLFLPGNSYVYPLATPILLCARPLLYHFAKGKITVGDSFASKTEVILTGIIGTTCGIIAFLLI